MHRLPFRSSIRLSFRTITVVVFASRQTAGVPDTVETRAHCGERRLTGVADDGARAAISPTHSIVLI
ncbi:hypothetical protein RR48_11691 [Papilio machaon]|uniref:Uncharacterized protein n=1 Tax=Papilio machaon TaxID=76193 RepID=A0A194QMS0_PAPMA|nr:hypothetical protein RR48_11691 [Papilio machaon]